MKEYNSRLLLTFKLLALFCLGIFAACDRSVDISSNSPGVTSKTIRLGSVLVLEGQDEALGNGVRKGIEAALAGEKIQGRSLELVFKNDYYEPATARKATEELLEENDIFLALGNVGTPTAQVTLPLLAEQSVPAVGFFTGAKLLRDNPLGTLVNYRASYGQEIAAVIDMAIAAGVAPTEICAYVQNDGYGVDALKNLQQTLAKAGASQDIIDRYEEILSSTGDRNNLGPVGVYTRNTPYSEPGYSSLKKWESQSGNKCRLIVTAATYRNLAYFIQKSRIESENWLVSALSVTGADELHRDLQERDLIDGTIVTQVVPLSNSNLPIVESAKNALKEDFGLTSLEGYIVGKMLLKIMQDIPGELTRENFLLQVQKSKFDLGGIPIDFTDGNNQGSNLVVVSQHGHEGFSKIEPSDFAAMLEKVPKGRSN